MPPALTRCFRLLLFVLMTPSVASAGDWTYWRGPEFNGVSRETGLIDNWDPQGGPGSHVAWIRDDLGGLSTPVVMNGKLYTIVRADPGMRCEGEKVVCVDAANGQTIWENRFAVYLSDVPDSRVGWSSCVADPDSGHVYALGVCGVFLCMNAETGKTVWSVPMHEQFGLLSTYGGRTNFPIVMEDLVIVSAVVIGWGEMAKPAHRLIAFDKRTGDVVWFRGTRPLPEDTTYSGPAIAILNGQQALVFGSGDGAVWAFQPRTGERIWNFRLSRRGLNLAPLVVGDRVLMGHSEENIEGTAMGTVVAIDGTGEGDVTDSAELWRVDELMAGKSSPAVINKRLFVVDDRAKLHVLDLDTGEPIGGKINLGGTMMRASPLVADGKIYAVTANGKWNILVPDENRGAKILKKGRLPEGEECVASPICANGSIYLQTTGRLYCLRDDDQPHGQSGAPDPPVEAALDDGQPVVLQVVPAEVLVAPGEQQAFRVRLFNRAGQLLRETPAEFSLVGDGQIDDQGVFTATGRGHAAVYLTARAEGLEGSARIRVVPPLPWNFDFEDIQWSGPAGEPPITWVGCRYRHVIRELDGNKVLVKVTTIPKGTRSRCWFGQSSLSDYTIEADVRGAIQNKKMPDIGLIAQGYTLDLQGANQKLEVRSWVTQRRIAETVDYAWQPDRWYIMKLRVENHPGKTLLRGKVWPKGDPEPTDWTVQAEDECPVLSGSPGLYGNAKDAELYLDNIRVSRNEEAS